MTQGELDVARSDDSVHMAPGDSFPVSESDALTLTSTGGADLVLFEHLDERRSPKGKE